MTTGSSSSGNSTTLISPCTSEDSVDDDITKFVVQLDTMYAYLVKDLDSGQHYRVEEMDQQHGLVTLDNVKDKLAHSYV
jgi:hypothetical protein